MMMMIINLFENDNKANNDGFSMFWVRSIAEGYTVEAYSSNVVKLEYKITFLVLQIL